MNKTKSFKKITLKRGLIAAALGVALATGAAGLQARGGHDHVVGPFGGSPISEARIAQKMGLNEEQRAQIDEITSAARSAMRPFANQLVESRRAMRAMEEFDETEYRRLAKLAADARVEMQVIRARSKSEINALLSPEQQQMFAKMSERRGRGKHRGHRRHGGKGHRGGWQGSDERSQN